MNDPSLRRLLLTSRGESARRVAAAGALMFTLAAWMLLLVVFAGSASGDKPQTAEPTGQTDSAQEPGQTPASMTADNDSSATPADQPSHVRIITVAGTVRALTLPVIDRHEPVLPRHAFSHAYGPHALPVSASPSLFTLGMLLRP